MNILYLCTATNFHSSVSKHVVFYLQGNPRFGKLSRDLCAMFLFRGLCTEIIIFYKMATLWIRSGTKKGVVRVKENDMVWVKIITLVRPMTGLGFPS